ncbi:iron ion transporter [Schizosaccharomyces japonicus yFS275]|uniref:Iron ion transporter n=1 Tax=Schizosaccharomyces japonicus (strain yFS275 / FY16936) TaxID=402676 RepID=B6K2K4_SCHJY|nr:iron ion transporter [Schizosaccharomyces japonicus yFS275]EEB07385.1 iron ion transporter [Schizosaccharomyces japonicus yFS275]
MEDLDYDYEGMPVSSPTYAHLLAGAFAGICEHTVMYPVDAIKTRMQLLNSTGRGVSGSVFGSVAKISSAEGFTSLWRGVTSVVMGAGPAHAIYFSVFEFVKSHVNGSSDRPLATAFAGGSAITISDAFLTPFDMIKQRMQLPNHRYRSVFHCASSVYKNEGIGAFFISYPTSIAMSIPFTAAQVAAYDYCMGIVNPTGVYAPWSHIVSGGVSGALAAAITTPLDVVKTLLQTRGSSSVAEVRSCRGLKEAIAIIHRLGGFRAFFKGIRPRVIVSMPATAVSWASYEFGKEVYKRLSPRDY